MNDNIQEHKSTEKQINSFDELDISAELLRGIYGYGFEKPSPIQARAILPMMEGRDLIAQAQSGTGKTGAFVIGTLANVDTAFAETQAIIMLPTHELSHQVADVMTKIGAMMPGLRVKTLVGSGGGSVNAPLSIQRNTNSNSVQEDMASLHNKIPHVIVGCPGRICDMLNRGAIVMTQIRQFVLDEADEMLSRGFEEQVRRVYRDLPEVAPIAMFSATLSPEMMRFAETLTNQDNTVRIEVAHDKLSLDGIKQYYVEVYNDMQKYDTIKDLYQHISLAQCIIYCNSVERVLHLYADMKQDQFPVGCIHSRMSGGERNAVFDDFKSGKIRVLISSDITARGIDVQQVNMVVNFDVSKNEHTYLHRIGRSGRWGRKGTAINLITPRDAYMIQRLETYYCCQISALPSAVVSV